MKAHNSIKYLAYPSILSEYMKFLAHNSQYEVVLCIEKWLLEVEHSTKANK